MKAFLGQKKGAKKAEVLSRAIEHANLKHEAAELTRLSDDALERAIVNRREERLRWLQ